MERGEAINYRKLIVSLQDVNNSERFPLSLASSVVTLGSGGGRINREREREMASARPSSVHYVESLEKVSVFFR